MEKEKRKKVKISKYDIIKVKVHLDQHFFVFSRYILANILRVIKVIKKLILIIKKIFFNFPSEKFIYVIFLS